MKVSDFIEWLKTQDQGAIVHVMAQEKAPSFTPWGDCIETPFDPNEHANYTDFRNNKFVKGQPYENERHLTLGTRD